MACLTLVYQLRFGFLPLYSRPMLPLEVQEASNFQLSIFIALVPDSEQPVCSLCGCHGRPHLCCCFRCHPVRAAATPARLPHAASPPSRLFDFQLPSWQKLRAGSTAKAQRCGRHAAGRSLPSGIPRYLRIGLTAAQHEELCCASMRQEIEIRSAAACSPSPTTTTCCTSCSEVQEAQAILDYGFVAEMEAVQTPSAARLARRPLRGSLALVAWAIDEIQLALAMGAAAVSAAAAAAAPKPDARGKRNMLRSNRC